MKKHFPVFPVATAVLLLLALACGPDNKPVNIDDGPYKWDKEKEMEPVVIDPEKTYYPKEKGAFRIMSYNVGALHKYIPALATSILVLPVSLWLIVDCIKVSDFSPIEITIYSLAATVAVGANLLLAHWLARKFGESIDNR